jgi:hypothetical protein
LAEFRQTCSSYEEEAQRASKSKGQGELAKGLQAIVLQCRQKFVELYVNQLRLKYTKADFEWVSKQMQAGADVECLLAASHNAGATAYIDARRADEAAFMRSQMGNINGAIALTAPPPAPPERSTGQKALQALSLILSGTGQGLTSAGNRGQTSGAAAVQTRDCSSDYSCGVGFTCVKNNFSASGYCAKNVNPYGVQQFDAADPGSVNVKTPSKRDCQFDSQCPVGFRCEASSGACVK